MSSSRFRAVVLRRRFLDRHQSVMVVWQDRQVQAAGSSLQLRYPMVQHLALPAAAQSRGLCRRRRDSNGRGQSLVLSEEDDCAAWPLF